MKKEEGEAYLWSISMGAGTHIRSVVDGLLSDVKGGCSGGYQSHHIGLSLWIEKCAVGC